MPTPLASDAHRFKLERPALAARGAHKMQVELLRLGKTLPILPTFSTLLLKRKFCPLGALIVALLASAGCSSSPEKPAPPPPGVTITPAVVKDVPIRQEWVGTMA